jgi:hypothetical protein
LVVNASATDDAGLASLELLVQGVAMGSLAAPPFQFAVRVPTSDTELSLVARATDHRGQVATSPEVVVSIIADPGTLAIGRVGDLSGSPVAGALVQCQGASDTSGLDGTFQIAAVPTLPALISCAATATGAFGEELTGRSGAVAPVAGATTLVGDVVLVSQLLFLGGGDGPSSLPEGRLFVLDQGGVDLLAWSYPFFPSGLSALTFDDGGGLFAATLGGVYGGPEGSEFLRLDASTGQVMESFGLLFDAATQEPLAVRDLTYDAVGGRLFALSVLGDLFTLEAGASEARRWVDRPGLGGAGGLAFGSDGLLYVLLNGEAVLLEIYDPSDGTLLAQRFLPFSSPGVVALERQPVGDRFLLTDGRDLYEFDPVAESVILIANLSDGSGFEVRGLASLLPADAPVVTSGVGKVVDLTTGLPVAGAVVRSLGVSTTTGADGSFSLPNVAVPLDHLRVAVEFFDRIFIYEPMLPVAGGVSDVGTLSIAPGPILR